MEKEYLDIYNEDLEYIGIEERETVHKKGLWHKTFHCWITRKVDARCYLLFQKRHKNKDTFPEYYDISAAGHLTTGEKIEDGVRELKEELGLQVYFDELKYLATIRRTLAGNTFIDREYCNVFLYNYDASLEKFIIQKEELSGLVYIDLEELEGLFFGKDELVAAVGFEINEKDELFKVNKELNINDFVPHGHEYYMQVIKGIRLMN